MVVLFRLRLGGVPTLGFLLSLTSQRFLRLYGAWVPATTSTHLRAATVVGADPNTIS